MLFILQYFLTIIFAYTLQLFLPWWSIGLTSFVVSFFIKTKGWKSFLGGFSAISTLWMVIASIIDVQTQYIISSKIAPLFKLNNSIYLVLLTGLIGGIVGGFFSLSGSYFRIFIIEVVKNDNDSKYMHFN